MGLFDRALQRKVLDAAGQYFTRVELERARVRGDSLILFDARFTLQDGELRVASVPADAWLRDRVATIAPDEATWEVAAYLKVRRFATPVEVTERARTGELYDESYFTKRGGGAPYVGYPRELTGFEGNFAALGEAIIQRYAPRRVLDIGCATGHLVKTLRDAGVECEGLDFSNWAVTHAVTRVTHGSALDLPWEAGVFDFVVSQDFMEHMHLDDLPRVIAEQVRVLQSGGRLVHLIPFYDSDPPIQVDAHLCQATQDWWMRFLRAQPNVDVVREPVANASDLLDRYVELRRREMT